MLRVGAIGCDLRGSCHVPTYKPASRG
jgi:hypothetical protein